MTSPSPVQNAQPPSNAAEPVAALSLQDVSFHYGRKPALSQLSVSIEPGECVILLGPNGAGKTTLFSLICGLFAADSGKILINERSLLERADALAPLGIVFQSQTLDLDLTIEQNLLYFCSLHGLSRADARRRIGHALKRMDLHQRAHDKVRSLNGGHRRRVEIVRATLHEPSILLLDEPTVGLDIPTREELIHYLHNLPSATGCAILWATHLIDEIREEDRVLILHQGQLKRDGTASSLTQAAGVSDLSAVMQQVLSQ